MRFFFYARMLGACIICAENVRFGSSTAVQSREKTSIQCPTLPDSGSQSRLERHRSPWVVRAAGLQHFEWLLWSRTGGRFEQNTQREVRQTQCARWPTVYRPHPSSLLLRVKALCVLESPRADSSCLTSGTTYRPKRPPRPPTPDRCRAAIRNHVCDSAIVRSISTGVESEVPVATGTRT